MFLNDGDKIVFIGDSVTDAGRARPVGEGGGDRLGNGFVKEIDNFLNVCYPERKIHVVNMGVSGNTSVDLISRFDTDLVDLKPKYAVICIGFNDVWRQFDEPTLREKHVKAELYEKNLEKIVGKCLDNDIVPIFMTPYYMEPNKSDAMRKTMEEYAKAMGKVAKEKGVDLIDLQAAFDKLLKYRYPASICWDRIHPQSIGSLVIAKTFLKYAGFDFKRLEK